MLPPPHHSTPFSSRLSRSQHTPYTLPLPPATTLGRLRLSLAGEGGRAPLYPKEAEWPPIAERRRCLCAKLPRRRAFLPPPSFLSAANTGSYTSAPWAPLRFRRRPRRACGRFTRHSPRPPFYLSSLPSLTSKSFISAKLSVTIQPFNPHSQVPFSRAVLAAAVPTYQPPFKH